MLGYGATQIGIPIYGVIAGLGVGGLAIALAAQPTIENLIGGIILYADRMVRVGEFCQFDDLAGTVESIGIRSTRIRRSTEHSLPLPMPISPNERSSITAIATSFTSDTNSNCGMRRARHR